MKSNKKLKIFYIFDTIVIVISLSLTKYYDMLPGYGMMPGLTYLSEFVFWFLTFCLCMFLLIIVTVINMIVKVKNRFKN